MSPIYPRLLRRVRAALIDYVIFVVLFVVWLFSLSLLESAHAALKIAPLLAGLLLLEPGLVSWTGGTIGHHLMGLRIRDAVGDHHIGFARATMRALIRTLLGWFSFVFILATRKHQAIHDYLFRTAVVLRHPSALPESERLPERVVPDGFVLPSRLRRASIIVLYGATSLVALTFAVEPLISDSCAYYDVCSASEDVILGLLGVVWFALVFAIIVFGCRGQLFGCRRRRSTG